MKIEQKPAYKHLFQKPSFCGPASIQMALFRRGIWIDQEELAFEIGAKIAKGRRSYLQKFEETTPKEAGIYINNTYKINKFFKAHNISLIAEHRYLKDIENIRQFIVDNLKENNDLIPCFVSDVIKQDVDLPDIKLGHYAPIAAFDTDSEKVTLYDPYSYNKSEYELSVEELRKRMSKGYFDSLERGFIIIKEVKKK